MEDLHNCLCILNNDMKYITLHRNILTVKKDPTVNLGYLKNLVKIEDIQDKGITLEEVSSSSVDIFESSDEFENPIDESDFITAGQPVVLRNSSSESVLSSGEDGCMSDSLLSNLNNSVLNVCPKTTQLAGWSSITPFRSVSTPKRIKISLGADYSANSSEIEWSVSMQTPHKEVKKCSNIEYTLPEPVCRIEHVEKVIKCDNYIESSLNNKKETRAENEYCFDNGSTGFQSPKIIEIEDLPVVAGKSSSSLECVNNAPLILRYNLNGPNEITNSKNDDLSLSCYFSNSISPTVLDGICQVSEVFDKLDSSFSDDDMDENPRAYLTTSTPLLKKKFSQQLAAHISPSPVSKNENPRNVILPEDLKPNEIVKPIMYQTKQITRKFLYPSRSQIVRNMKDYNNKSIKKISFDPELDTVNEVSIENSNHLSYETATQAFEDFPITQTTLKELSNAIEIAESVHACKNDDFSQFELSQEQYVKTGKKTPVILNVPLNKIPYSNFITPLIESSKNYNNAIGISKRLFNSDPAKEMGDVQFKTASGKDVLILDEIISSPIIANQSITMNMFDEDFRYESEPPEKFMIDDISEREVLRVDNETKATTKPQIFVGFTSASGKKVTVSNEALEKVQTFFSKHEDCCVESTITSSKLSSFPSFSTASGKNVTILEQSLSKVKSIFVNEELVDSGIGSTLCPSTSINFPGFNTGSGKKVSVSDDAQKKVGTLFSEPLERNGTPRHCGISGLAGFSTGSGKKISVSDDPLGKNLFDNEVAITNYETSGFAGFSTGSGKKVSISDVALKKARTLFSESLQQNETPRHCGTAGFAGFSTGSGKKVSISDDALKKARTLFSESLQQNETPQHCGTAGFAEFSTGSGKKVSISDDALKKARTLFSESLQQNETPRHCGTAGFAGFSTGSGKKVSISDDALKKARTLFSESLQQNETPQHCGTAGFAEFSTGSGKKVSISDDALKKARTLFSESLQQNETPRHCGTAGSAGFSTGSGKKVSISDDALKKAKFMFNEEAVTPVLHIALFPGPLEKANKPLFGQDNGDGFKTPLTKNITDLSKSVQPLLNGSVTANGGNITVYEEAIAKVNYLQSSEEIDKNKILLAEKICNTEIKQEKKNSCDLSKTNSFKGFSTGLGKTIKISDEALEKAKNYVSAKENLWDKREEYLSNTKSSVPNSAKTSTMHKFIPGKKTPEHLKSLENNFIRKNTFSTPFHSPRILNTKRVNFYSNSDVQPANKKQKLNNNQTIQTDTNLTSDNQNIIENSSLIKPGLLYNKKYIRQENKLSLKKFGKQRQLYSEKEILQTGVTQKILEISSTNSEDFRFENLAEGNSVLIAGDNASVCLNRDGSAGKEEISSAFMAVSSVDSCLISEKWVFNHYRWIIWKLASMEISFPIELGGKYLTLDHVLYQLKLRYDREIDKNLRSPLKKIMERDDTPAKTIVLCVAAIFTAHNPELATTIELTDGWYSINASIDPALCELVRKGKIFVGQKLVIHGAELSGSNDGCDPLEAPPELKLKISANSTRAARWYTKLGFQPRPQPFTIPLKSILSDGGIIPKIDCVISRIYPVQFMERYPDGHTVIRGPFAEKKAAQIHDKLRDEYLEKMVSKLRADLEGKENITKNKVRKKGGKGLFNEKIKNIYCGAELHEVMETYSDFMSFKEILNDEQIQILENYLRSLQESEQTRINTMISREIDKLKKSTEFPLNRDVVSYIKVKLLSLRLIKEKSNFSCLLTIWRPNEALLEMLEEGKAYSVTYVVPRSARNQNSQIQLTTTNKTRYKKLADADWLERMVIPFWKFRSKHSNFPYEEVDIVGLIFEVERRVLSSGLEDIQKIYLVDHRNNMLQIKFYTNISNICADNALNIGNFIAVCNLRRQLDVCGSVPTLIATEITTITTFPKKAYLKEAIDLFKSNVQDEKALVKATQEKLNNMLNTYKSPIIPSYFESPPIRLHYPVYSPNCFHTPTNANLSTNSSISRAYTPVSRRDGLKISSPITIEPDSPADLVSKRTKEKIMFLEKYGEPISLPNVTSPVANKVRKPFKVPILKKD